jgi:hypothetical protein
VVSLALRRGAIPSPSSCARRPASSVVAERVGPAVDVECGDCGEHFDLSVRREYAHRLAGTSPKCMTCRRPATVMSEDEREAFVAWWLHESGPSVDELLEIAVGLAVNRRTVTPRDFP